MSRTLRLRSSGDDVKFLQERLNSLPTALPPLPLDGKYGAKTRDRVKEFQGNNALPVDGVVGPPTWGQLLGYAVVKTTGFFVLGRDLYDRRGVRVLLRGVNKMSVWDLEDPVGLATFPEIKQTGANSVRIVWAITSNLEPGGPATALARLNPLIANAKANHLVPMIELHDATGKWGRLNDLVDYWTQPAVVKILRRHKAYLLVNIANEAGDYTVSRADFVAGYSNAVQRMRAARGGQLPRVGQEQVAGPVATDGDVVEQHAAVPAGGESHQAAGGVGGQADPDLGDDLRAGHRLAVLRHYCGPPC